MQKIKLHMLEKYNYFENIFLQSWSLDDEGSHEKETAWFELPDGFEIAAGKDGIKRVYDLRNGEKHTVRAADRSRRAAACIVQRLHHAPPDCGRYGSRRAP